MREAAYYIKKKNQTVKCMLCPHECIIKNGQVGICTVRENKEGRLYTNTFNQLSSMAIDPIEKKPFNRFKAGSHILSVGTYGCNLSCKFCQNYHISKMKPPLERMTSDELVALSESHRESIGIAFTYNEPTIWFEYIKEVASKNKKDTVLVTNGYINQAPLMELLPYIDAMNIDLKSMKESFYHKICNGSLEQVKQTIIRSYEKTHVEITFLAIPGVNDSEEEMKEMASFIQTVDRKIPLHIIPFRPMYQMKEFPYQTYEKIEQLKKIASKSLQYVY